MRNEIFDLLINGWIITSTNPIRILNVDNRKRKIIYPKLNSNNKTQKKKERKNNTVETSSGAINVYLESDDSSNSDDLDQELSYSTSTQNRSPTKGNRNSQEDNHSLINGLKQNPNQELLNMKLAEKQEKWLKKKELLQRGVSAQHDVKSNEKSQKQQKNTEEEEEEIDEEEKEESKRLRERFNEIHDQFLNTIGPLFNNNNEYIVYNTTPGSPSQSRLVHNPPIIALLNHHVIKHVPKQQIIVLHNHHVIDHVHKQQITVPHNHHEIDLVLKLLTIVQTKHKQTKVQQKKLPQALQ